MPLRHQDPTTGRWNGIDPVTHFSSSTYAGYNNNPVYWADPSGANGHSFWGAIKSFFGGGSGGRMVNGRNVNVGGASGTFGNIAGGVGIMAGNAAAGAITDWLGKLLDGGDTAPGISAGRVFTVGNEMAWLPAGAEAAADGQTNNAYAAASLLTVGLLLDDGTVVGVIDDVLIPGIWIYAWITAANTTTYSSTIDRTKNKKNNEYVTIYKAPQAGKGQKLLLRGFQKEDFPRSEKQGENGIAYFAGPNSRSVAAEYNRYYGEGILEIKIPKNIYMERFFDFKKPYDGGSKNEIPIPQELFDLLNTFPRILKPY